MPNTGSARRSSPNHPALRQARISRIDTRIIAGFTPAEPAKTNEKFKAMEAGDRKTLEEEFDVELFVPPEEQVAEATELVKANWDAWAAEHGAEDALKEVREALGR